MAMLAFLPSLKKEKVSSFLALPSAFFCFSLGGLPPVLWESIKLIIRLTWCRVAFLFAWNGSKISRLAEDEMMCLLPNGTQNRIIGQTRFYRKLIERRIDHCPQKVIYVRQCTFASMGCPFTGAFLMTKSIECSTARQSRPEIKNFVSNSLAPAWL